MRRAVWLLVAAVVLAGILLLFILPGRTLLAQDRSLAAARHRSAVLGREDAALTQRAAQLKSTAYIEQLARQQYGLVMPGEQAYGIVPPAPSTTTTTVPASEQSFWQHLRTGR